MANMTGGPWDKLKAEAGGFDPIDGLVPPRTTFLAMLETMDGCIKFLQLPDPWQEYVTASVAYFVDPRPGTTPQPDKIDPLNQFHTKITKRTYDLIDRSGPGGVILHYKERVE